MRKLSLLYEMRNLSEKALNYVDEESVERLNGIFDDKQELIYEIDRLDNIFLAEFNKLKSEYNLSSIEVLNPAKSPELENLRRHTEEIMDLLHKIETLDRNVNQRIAKLRQDITAELTRIRKQRHISDIYSGDAGIKIHKVSAYDIIDT